MKLKKIKLKKKNSNPNINQANIKPKKTSGIMIGFISLTALLFLVIGILIFGIWFAIPFVVVYLLLLWLVRTIDRYPINSRKRKRAKNAFMIILLIGIIGILAFIVFFIIVIISSPDFDVDKLERNEKTRI